MKPLITALQDYYIVTASLPNHDTIPDFHYYTYQGNSEKEARDKFLSERKGLIIWSIEPLI